MLENPPVIARNRRGPKLVRFGVFGSLSDTSSPSARSDRIMIAPCDPAKDSHEPLRSSQPRCAAQLTSAGAVSDRNPAMTPMEKHPRKRTALLTFMPTYFSRQRALVNTARIYRHSLRLIVFVKALVTDEHVDNAGGALCISSGDRPSHPHVFSPFSPFR